MRRRMYEIIEKTDGKDKLSLFYDVFMLVVIVASLIPLTFKTEYHVFEVMDIVTVSIFIVDYICRWATADYKLEKQSVWSFVLYPFTFMAIIDLCSIVPSLSAIWPGVAFLHYLKMFRALRVLRILKILRYSTNFEIILDVLKASRKALLAVGTLAVFYILVAALVLFNVEPDTFRSFFDALYWATISLAAVGYGDIYPVTAIGRFFTMVSCLFGVAVVALPAGIITAGYMQEVNRKNVEARKNEEKKED